MCCVLVEKNGQKCHFFTFFGVTRQIFLGYRLNISTNEPVLERLLNFWIFGSYLKLIAHLVRAKEPPKAKKSKIRVTRKPDLETRNWVYTFSSFIEPYQTHIVTAQMLSTFFHLLDRVMYIFLQLFSVHNSLFVILFLTIDWNRWKKKWKRKMLLNNTVDLKKQMNKQWVMIRVTRTV